MKKLLLIMLNLIGMMVFAQPTITSADIITGTFSYRDSAFPQGVYTPGNSGANVTWDFSNLPSIDSPSIFFGICPGIAGCNSFPTANHYSSLIDPSNGSQSSVKDMFRLTDTQYEPLGAVNQDSNEVSAYTDTPILLKFPTVYLQTFTDTTSITLPSTTATTITNDVVTVDGYGTIITPTDTYTNVLRVKRVSNQTTTINGTPVNSGITTTYTWYKNGREVIATFTELNDITPIPGAEPSGFTYTTSPNLATEDWELSENQISLYPNPVSDFVSLKTKETVLKSKITNMEGKMVLQSEKTNKINISHLPSGVYILKAELRNGKSVVKKFVKKP